MLLELIDQPIKKSKKKKKSLGVIQTESDFLIQPSNEVPKLDTSEWPLLLKVTSLLETFKPM